MKGREHTLLQRRLEVDEDVAAGDQVEMRKRRIAHDVLPREHAQVTHRLVDSIAGVLLDEKPLQSLPRHRRRNAIGVASRSGSGNRRFAQVRREDLNADLCGLVSEKLEQSDRVKLLRRALDKLAPTLRTAVMLRDIQELTYQEIADRLRLPEGTVKSRINRGRTELARQIQRLREEQDAVPKTGVSG